MLRLFVESPLAEGEALELPAAAARHVQVRRLQPGDALTLFNGQGGEWQAEVVSMGRSKVAVRPLLFQAVQREPRLRVTLAVGMPANERMDWLVEKAAELGADCIVPLMCERSVLRLDGERARKRREHWQAVAIAAAEQCGATRVTQVAEVQALTDALAGFDPAASRGVLSLRDGASRLEPPSADSAVLLSGPEGGLTESEEGLAIAAGFQALSLGSRVLRAETAPVVALARWISGAV